MFTASSWWYCHYAFYICKCRWLKIFWSLQLLLYKQFSVCCFFNPLRSLYRVRVSLWLWVLGRQTAEFCRWWLSLFFSWISPNSLHLLTRKKLLVIQKYFCSASSRTGDGLWKLELKTASICFTWMERSCAELLLLFVGHVFLNSVFSINVEMSEIRSNILWLGLFFVNASAVQQAVWHGYKKWKGWQCYFIGWLNVCEYILHCSSKTTHCLD